MRRTFLRTFSSERFLAVGLASFLLGSGSLGPTEAVAQGTSSSRAAVLPCSQQQGLRSEHSREPTKITFVNKSGMYRAVIWIDFKGGWKDYGGMNPGETKSINTFRTHPWIVSDGPGNCKQIVMPAAEPATVILR